MQPTRSSTEGSPDTTSRRGRLVRSLLWVIAGWAAIAYLIAPQAWKLYYGHRGNEFAQVERLTQTSDHHPGDPLNIVLVGDEKQLVRALAASGWYPADPITLKSSLQIAADSVLRRPDDQAPVSNLYLFGRRQDLAFEQPVPGGPSHRHHVRFWKWDQTYEGRPVWFGAATYDERVGLSYTTGQVTHHIGPDIDAERDRIVAELRKEGVAQAVEWRNDFHRQRQGRNGGGDPWHTDGRLAIVLLDDSGAATR
jgi:hypothetical protein